MANAASTIEIELEIRQAINRLDRLQRELTQSTQSFNKAAQATRKFEGAINKAKAGLVAFFAAISVQKLAQLSDAMTQFENRVKLATNSLVQQLAVQQQLFQVAQKTALPLEDVGQLYSRLRIAAEQLGASQRDLINLTETVGLALKASGTSAASAQGALLQLGQALNSPRVQAEEFNSLIDGMPNLLREVEKQLGLTAGGLKKFVTDGQLSNKKFFDAILASQKALTQQANSSASTIEQANQRVANSFTSLIGAIDDKLGASKFFTGFIDGLASGIDKLSNFLGLTTQATGGGGGGANLDEVIKEQTGLITDLEASFEGLSIYATTQIMAISEAFEDSNLTIEEYTKKVEAFVKSYTEFYDKVDSGELPGFPSLQFDPETQEQLFLSAEQARKEFELIFKFIAQGFKAFENLNGEAEKYLTYLERITNYLSEQLRLLELSEENANRTAGAIVSGVSGAGPNASRAANIAQSKSIEEAAAKLILSNEKVAAAIEEYFTLLFDTLDPLIDILGDLISSINKLIGALLEGAGNAIENFANSLGIGPDSYIGSGGFIRDIEALGGGAIGGAYQPTASEALQIAVIEDLRDIVDGQEETLNNLLDAARESGNLVGVVELFKQSINNLIPALTKNPDLQTYEQILQRAYDNMKYMPGVDTLEDYVKYYQDFIDATTGELPRAEAYVAVGTAELIIQELASQISGTGTNVSDFEGISDLVTKTAQEQIDSIHFQNLTAEEQIHFRNEETVAMLNQQKIFIQLVDDEERRADLLTKIAAAEAKQLELYNLQLSELQKLNEEREREAELLLQQQGQAQVDKLLSDLERTFDDIIELVQGLRDQASGLLLGQYSTASATDRFSTAADTYSDLLAAALDPEATEENVKDFQDFVDTYLKSAQDVFKSSSRYQNIFNSVLADIEEVAEFVQATMPQSEIDKVREQLTDVAEEFGLGVEEVIEGLDRLVLALTFRALVVDVPVQTVIDEGNSDLIVEAVVTAVEDQNLSDTEIISIVTAVADQLSDTQIEEIVTAVAASGSDTNIEAVVSATASNVPIIQALVSAIAANIPTVVVDVEFNLDPINEAIANLGATLQGAVTNFIIDVNQASGAIEGQTLSTLQALSQGGSVYTGSLYASNNPTVYVYDRNTGTTFADSSLIDTGNRNLSVADLAATYQASGLIERNYYVFTAYDGGMGELSGFDDLTDAKRYSFSKIGSGYDVQKIGFRRGGLVDPMDTIPAMLSPGEYILSPETVRRYGVSNLNRLNSGDSAALNATSDPEVKRLLAELIVAVKENDTEVNVFTDMEGQTKASIEEFRSELRERTRRQGDKFLPARYI